MITGSTTPATLDDLYREEGKAELIGGRIVRYTGSGGYLPSGVAAEISVTLRLYGKSTGRGTAYSGGLGYAIPELPSGRESFQPDASFYGGPLPRNRMRFIDGPPTFAVEVRRENDYGPTAEADIAAKRHDYFAAGTRVVWDVDALAETVAAFRSDAPAQPVIYGRGDIADAEPALPGWRMAVDDMFNV